MEAKTIGDKIADTAKRWTINVIQVIVAIAVINVVMMAGFFYLSPDDFIDIWGANSQPARILARCGKLEEELTIDYVCIYSDDCTLTRDDMQAFDERAEKHEMFCEDSAEQ